MSSLGTASSDIPRRKLRSNSVIGINGVLGADPDRSITLPSGAMSWIATTRWLVVKRVASMSWGALDSGSSARWRALGAVASSTPANNDRYRIASNPAPAKVNATKTTLADTAAGRAETPYLAERT